MEAYHQLSFLPNTPHAIDRLRDELRRHAESLGHTTLQIGHRALARAIECSAARLSELMARLELAGEIVREPFKNTFLIDVSPLIDHPAPPDRSPHDDMSPPLIDHPMPDRDLPHQDAPNNAQIRDRVEMPCKVLKTHDQNQEKEIARPLFEQLMTEPTMSYTLATRIATHPIGTLADFMQDYRLAQSMPGVRTPFWFTVSRWRDGQRVVAPEEPQHAQPNRATATRTRRRSEAHRPSRAADTAAPIDYDALLAEWERTAPAQAAPVYVSG